MSGSGAQKRNQAMALRCAKLAAQGWTHRAIAETVGKKPEQIKALVLLGQRLRIDERLEGRQRKPLDIDDIGIPDFLEDHKP